MAGLGRRAGIALLGLLALAGTPSAASAQGRERWVAAWATSQLVPSEANSLPPATLTDATLRQVVRIQIAGKQLRVRFSNAFGTAPLAIGAATIARSADLASPRIDPATLRTLTFGGKPGAVIPAGADYWSDPVALAVPAGADLTISIHLPQPPAQLTSHPGSRATSYTVRGNQTAAADLPDAAKVDRWYQLGGIEVVDSRAAAVVVLGDSITDGYGVQPNTNARWTDALQARLRAAKMPLAVLNAGIGGGRLLNDGLGPNALARFDRDVLSPPGVTHLIVLEGVNDLGTLTREAPASAEAHAALVEGMIGAYRQIVARARAHGIKAIGATILPFGRSGYYHPDAQNEADRAAVNAWIRASRNFDAVIDLDAAMRDPARPNYLRADFDNDGLHPSIVGYAAMAAAVPLAVFQ
ncbi:SGNH/GDSL hydrolase family protein [Sphingomonas sp. CJ20]